MSVRKGTRARSTQVHEVKKKKIRKLTQQEIKDFDREFEKSLGEYIWVGDNDHDPENSGWVKKK